MYTPRPIGARPLGGLSIPVLVLALAAFVLPAGNALAAYVFTGGGTNTGTATGDSAVTTLYIEVFSGLVYHSTDGIVFSPDWGGGLTIPAALTTTVNVVVATGDGSVVIFGGVLSPASALLGQMTAVCVANTTDQVVIDDSGSSAAVTYTVDTLPGNITAPGISFNQTASQAFQGGVTLKGSSGGDTFNVPSICCGGPTHEPFHLVGGAGSDTFNVGGGGTVTVNSDLFVTDTAGGGSLVVDDSADSSGSTVTISGTQITGVSNAAINFGSGVTAVTFIGGTGAETFLVTPNAAATLTVAGGYPTICPGDSLTVNLAGVTAPIVETPGATGAGQITFGNRSPLNYTGIESLTPTTATVGGGQAICAAGTTTGLGGNAPVLGTGQWSVVSGGTGTFSPSDTTPNATFTDTAGTGPVTLRWTISNPPCAASSADVAVTVNPIPAAPAASNTGPYHVGDTISLAASTVGGATYSWAGPLGFTSTGQTPTIPNATVAMSGTYSVTATVDGCTSPAGTTDVVVAPPIPTLSGLGLLALAVALAAVGFMLLRRRALS